MNPRHHSKLQYVRHDVDWTDEKVSRFWDFEAEFPQHFFSSALGDAIVLLFRNYLHGRRSVLDYGCGPGGLVKSLLNEGLFVAATDFSAEAISSVTDRYAGHPRFLGADTVEKLVATGATYDALFAVEVIEHLADDQLKFTINTIKRLLAPNGIAILTTPNDEDLGAQKVLCPDCGAVFHRYQHMRSWAPDSLCALMNENGLRVIKLAVTDFYRVWPTWSLPKAKMFVKTLLGMGVAEKKPHLYCVCSLGQSAQG